MKFSQMLIPTSKEVPADAEIPSHQLMVRAGLIRKLASGTYTYLPLGLRSLHKASDIVREEMNATGAQEVLMPTLQPENLWQRTGRLTTFGENLMSLTDRHGRVNLLGPTHEEIITDIAAHYINSYKQLPQCLYQIQTKFRDEFRPRFGVLRSREFLMKDAYSFHGSLESLDETYQQQYQAYCKIFQRCGLPYSIVEAESGPIGGSGSHEFMVPCAAGEDTLVRTEDGSYAANLERVEAQPLDKGNEQPQEELVEVNTPNVTTIDELTNFMKIEASTLIKTLIFAGTKENEKDKTPLVALVRGDHDVHETKLARAAGFDTVEMADEKTVQTLTNTAVGFAGPVGLEGVTIICDQAVSVMQNAVTGANKTDTHFKGVNPGRDFELKTVADIRFVTKQDRSIDGKEFIFSRGIEIGHVFKLGTKYSKALDATYLDEQGKTQTLIMGCYGIGINRILAAAIEVDHDKFGIIWPISIAPFEVIITTIKPEDQQVASESQKLYDQLKQSGIDVLLDDRPLRPGFKFKDADLIGISIRITIGQKGLAENNIELKLRRDPDHTTIPLTNAAEKIIEQVKTLYAELNKPQRGAS
jgi:prolyl-tRNA synthetase